MVVGTVVLVFVLFGQLHFAMGGGAIFTDLASALMGRHRDGPAKVAVPVGFASAAWLANVAGLVLAGGILRQNLRARVKL